MNHDAQQQLYLIADQLRHLASVGKFFAQNLYGKEHLDRLLELAAEVASVADNDLSQDEIHQLFSNEHWVKLSPIIEVNALVLNPKSEVLLIQRADNQHWAMPGGLSEVGASPAETAVKELWEEAGLKGQVTQLLAVMDNRLWDVPFKVHVVTMIFLLKCDELEARIGTEAVSHGFFSADNLPEPLQAGHKDRLRVALTAIDKPAYFDKTDANSTQLDDYQRG